jgi:hypothetical protein
MTTTKAKTTTPVVDHATGPGLPRAGDCRGRVRLSPAHQPGSQAAPPGARRAAEVINDLCAHQPDTLEPHAGPTGSAIHWWPCASFNNAAHQVMTARLRLAELVPLDLHPPLWPPKRQPSSAPQTDPPSSVGLESWFGRAEHADG